MSFEPRKSYNVRRIRKKSNPVTIGTHVSRSAGSQRRADSSELNYAQVRKNARGKRGMVETVLPNSTNDESPSERANRVNREHYRQSIERHARVRRAIGIALVLLVVVLIAGFVGSFAYATSVGDRMALADKNTKSALTAAEEGNPEYILIVGEYSEAGKGYAGPGLLTVVRLDAAQKQVTLMSIPANLNVVLSTGESGRIRDTQLLGNDTALIDEVEKVVGVPISHIVKTNNTDFVALIDVLGGISVDVSEEIDDPLAGSQYIPAGNQRLSGEASLTFCRATNLSGGNQARAENQNKVLYALFNELAASQGFSFVFSLDGIADLIETDLSVDDITALVNAFHGIPADSVYSSSVPGYTTVSESSGIEYFISDDAKWELMREAFKAGSRPEDAIPEVEQVDPASFDITVRNGSGITGGATQVAELLTSEGFQIKETGNADTFVYDETLVIYGDTQHAASAETVVSSLGVGRAVASNGFYTFDSAVLVVVGKDWKPFN